MAKVLIKFISGHLKQNFEIYDLVNSKILKIQRFSVFLETVLWFQWTIYWFWNKVLLVSVCCLSSAAKEQLKTQSIWTLSRPWKHSFYGWFQKSYFWSSWLYIVRLWAFMFDIGLTDHWIWLQNKAWLILFRKM